MNRVSTARLALAAVAVATALVVGLPEIVARATSITATTLSGGAGTATVSGTLYAKGGGALTLIVVTDTLARCVELSTTPPLAQTFASPKTSWTFTWTSPAALADGAQNITATAGEGTNGSGRCATRTASQTVSYVVDNSAPTVTATKNPNGAWANTDVAVTWAAVDTGSGVASGPTPASATVSAEGASTLTAQATDRLGFVGNGSTSVQIDKTQPTISGSASPAPNGNGWNNSNVTVSFNCTDPLNGNGTAASGIASCVGGQTLNQNGITAAVVGTAKDNASNQASLTQGPFKIDKAKPNAPTVSVTPAPAPTASGWNNSSVAVTFGANGDNPNTDASGVDACTAPIILAGETAIAGVTRSGTCTDKASNVSAAATSRVIKIDLTPPNTTTAAPLGWNNNSVALVLGATDNLSGVASTKYVLNGAAAVTGTGLTIATEGVHTVEFWSVDVAGNEETHKTIQVKIDKTNPTISHALTPAPNGAGWNNSATTVTFTCVDPGAAASGIASCTAPVTISADGKNQAVPGVAVDNAANSATDSATVDLDAAKPTIVGVPDRAANGNDWYNDDVIVSFTCNDQIGLSGVATCASSQTLTQGAGQNVSGTVTDNAGNTDSTNVGPLNIDKTAPTLTSAVSGLAGSAGWYRGDVTLSWTCGDTLSGLDGTCPVPTVLTGEGASLSAATSVKDRAGNQTNAAVTDIKIDRHAPTTSVNPPLPASGEWYGGDVSIPVSVDEQLSGLAKTYASIDGGAQAELTTTSISVSGNGSHTVSYWSVDVAGNVEAIKTLTIRIDSGAPTISGSRTAANAQGWNSGPVDVTFTCFDGESGIAGCGPDQTLGNEGHGQSATGTAVDNVGNTALAPVTGINIDLTKPTLTGAPTTDANAAGWYRDNVVIRWTPSDALSGVDATTAPADSTITSEGSNLGAGPVTVSDNAGLVSNPESVTGIKIDRTAPMVAAATVNPNGTPRSANTDGWFNSSVLVRFTCTDALSGPGTCADPVELSTDGAGQSASGTGFDLAGNSAAVTKSGINIDSQAPATVGDIVCTGKNGWCRNTATITLDATDQSALSGVKDIYYRFGTTGSFTKKADPVTFPVPLNSAGKATLQFYAMDKAGNTEAVQSANIRYDSIAPMISIAKAPNANAAGWNKSNLNVTVSAVDKPDAVSSDLGSGVETLTVDGVVVASHTTEGNAAPLEFVKPFTAETAGTALNAASEDFAGNVGSDSVTVKLDKTAPVISGATTTSPNSNGWYNAPVTIQWTCSDALSGVVCPANDVITTNGASQTRTGTAHDGADNNASTSVSGINIDGTAPTLAITGLAGSPFVVGATSAVGCTATDVLSGLDGACTVMVTGGTGAVGTFNVTATAKDLAGNTATATGTYKVVYGFTGFLQPVNDTGRPQICGTVCVASVFKGGSTIPVKFQLLNAAGAPIQAATAPLWVTPKQGSLTTLGIDEVIYTEPSTSGVQYRWDATSQQYIYNWGTKGVKIGYFWKIGVKLDDGNTYIVDVALR